MNTRIPRSIVVPPATISARRKNAGIGIIEVLVALVVVSFGVLGMASLQLTGMKHSSSGYNRSIAVLYAENLATRMRSNQLAVENLDYAGFDSDDGSLNCAAKPIPYCQATKNAAAQVCNSAEMAAFDLFSIACGTWTSANIAEGGVVDSLNSGSLVVNCLDGAACDDTSNYSIRISWDEGRSKGDLEGVDSKLVEVRFKP